MIFVFSVMTLKSLVADLNRESSCDEFAHLHLQNLVFPDLHDVHQAEISDQQKNRKACQDGKILSGQMIVARPLLDFSRKHDEKRFSYPSEAKNHFKSPDLEPHRKPPKIS